jgi:oligoribonuclease
MANRWFVLDLETTGLQSFNPKRMADITDQICEIGIAEIDADLNVYSVFQRVVAGDKQISRLEVADDVVRDMHQKSGLWDALHSQFESPDPLTIKDADSDAMDWLFDDCGWQPGDRIILVGSTIHFDREFIHRYMPKLYSALFHRVIDVSSIKELLVQWNPLVVATRPTPIGKHRVWEDMMDTLGELAHYRPYVGGTTVAPTKAETYEFKSSDTNCQVCGKLIEVTAFKDQGVCSVNCKKKRDGDIKSVPSY